MRDHEHWLNDAHARCVDAVRRTETATNACQAVAGQLAAATGADYVGVLLGDRIAAAAGPRSEHACAADIIAATTAGPAAEIGGVGRCDVALALDPSGLRVVLLRRQGSISRRERDLLALTVPVLSVTVELLAVASALEAFRESADDAYAEHQHLIGSLLKRQQLLDNLERVDRLRSARIPLQETLGAIVTAAQQRLGDDVVALQLVDPSDDGSLVVVSEVGLTPDAFNMVRRSELAAAGPAGRAVSKDALVVVGGVATDPAELGAFAQLGARSALSAPVHALGGVVGALTVASTSSERRFGANEQETLLTFAVQVSLALADAYGSSRKDNRREEVLTSAQPGSLQQDASLPSIISAVVAPHATRGRHLLIPPVPPQPLRIDVAKVSVALSNLVGSAITHSPRSSPLVIETDVAGGVVTVTITVLGEFPEGTDPTVMTQGIAPPAASGLGHDLYVAGQLAEAVDGSVSAECADGTMTFTLSFPAGASAATAARSNRASAH